jgi:hypothetical protein
MLRSNGRAWQCYKREKKEGSAAGGQAYLPTLAAGSRKPFVLQTLAYSSDGKAAASGACLWFAVALKRDGYL